MGIFSNVFKVFRDWMEPFIDEEAIESPKARVVEYTPIEMEMKGDYKLSEGSQEYIDRIISVNGPDAMPMFNANIWIDVKTGNVHIQPIVSAEKYLYVVRVRGGKGALVERSDLVAPSFEGIQMTREPEELGEAILKNVRKIKELRSFYRQTRVHNKTFNMDP